MPRRRFVLGTAAALGAVVVGWAWLPPRQRLHGSSPLPVSAGQVALNGWVKIGADDSVTVVMPKSEMGQGVHTGLAMLLAEELDADWARLRIEAAPVDRIYANLSVALDALSFRPDDDSAWRRGFDGMVAKMAREGGLMLTGGSSSLRDLWLPMRQAGASARAMLVAAAAARWQVAATECSVLAGRVSHPSGRSASFGELVTEAAQRPVPAPPELKAPGAFRLVGQPLPRLAAEAAGKVDGSARFGIDVLLPDMLYASVVMCPTLGGSVASFDAAPALALPGVKKVLSFDGGRAVAGGTGGVAVIAETPYHALRAVAQVRVQWAAGAGAEVSSAEIMGRLAAALNGPAGFAYWQHGDAEAALAGAARTLTADYSAPFLAHAAMEPINCTVRVEGDRATVWASTQAPDVARGVVARVLGLDDAQVAMEVQLIGGGFGRRLDVDFIAQAAQVAQAMPGVPVQTFWSREQDITHDFYRPACMARLRAGLDASGRLVAWTHHSAGQAAVPRVMERYAAGMTLMPALATVQSTAADLAWPLLRVPGISPDKSTAEGAFDQAYEFANARVSHTAVEAGVPIGFWRSVGHSHQAFFKECFIDEVATAAGQDAVAFRAGLLRQHPRHLAVLRRVAALAGWGEPLAPAADGAKKARGVALHESFGSIVAQVAEVSVGPVGSVQAIRVHRVVCVLDCGTAVNPNLVRQQMESGIVFGLSAALHGEITVEQGQVRQSNFHDVPCLRMDACPVVETDIIASTAPPQGVGEPGTPPIAPAVANAVFALTGQRLRRLPLTLA